MTHMLENDRLLVDETLLSTSNGYIGVRGNFEENYHKSYKTIRGSYINGFYDVHDITYGERAYGFPLTAQKMLNVTDAQTIQLNIDGDEFSLFQGRVVAMSRKLDILTGVALREIEWISPKGHHLKIQIKRMASFTRLELFTIEYHIESINYEGGITLFSSIEGEVENFSDEHDPRVSSATDRLLKVEVVGAKNNIGWVTSKTSRSNLTMNVCATHSVDMTNQIYTSGVLDEHYFTIKPGEDYYFTKYVVYTDSIRHEEPLENGLRIIDEVVKHGVEYYYVQQKAYLDHFWSTAYVKIEGDPSVEEALNYSIYQLLSSSGKDPHSNIPAKGLSGEGYEGHYFWDTEIYMMPLFTLTNPEISKNLLNYRYSILDKARDRALEMGHKIGAKIPWRTIAGSECSGYFPAGCAQYHINADVAYALIQYLLVTQDYKTLLDFGFEVLYETARIWIDMGHFADNGTFQIHGVTGPDEYSAIVNNNYYTNALAQFHLNWAVDLYRELLEGCLFEGYYLSADEQQQVEDLVGTLKITKKEVALMEAAAKKMYLPFSEALQVNLQDDAFLQKAQWDFAGTPENHHPLLLFYHPLTIYRYKVLKQADTVLSHLLLDNETTEIMRNSYHYYEAVTTHDSSLSPCVYSMMAARIGEKEKAYDYFMKTIRLDLDNLHHNTKDGLHIANAGGAYMSIVYGFAGLRIKKEGLFFRPMKPDQWKAIEFGLVYQGAKLNIRIDHRFTICCDKKTTVYINDKKYTVEDHLVVDYE